MRVNRYLLIGAIAMLLVPVGTVLPQRSASVDPADPSEVVKSFYRFHLAHNMSFTRPNVVRRQAWLSSTLYKLLLNEFVRENQYSRSHPREEFVPYMEGDPFTESQEYPNSFRMGSSLVTGDKADVKVMLLWGTKGGKSGDQRNIEVKLVKQNGKWLIDNIIDVDNKVNLVTDLKREKYLP